MEGIILKYALQNAVKYGGKANSGAVISHILADNPGLKSKIKDIAKEVNSIISGVNRLSLEMQRQKLQDLAPELLKEKQKEKTDLRELPNAKQGEVVTRMPPEPSKYIHIGHALSFLINYMYAQKYNGKCILRFEDANPEKVSMEYVDAMKEDVLNYLEIKPDKIVFVSDHMDIFYKYATDLIKMNKAFICFCEQEKMQDLRHKSIECKCRKKNVEINLKEWGRMLKGRYKEGGCSLRIKGDMKSQNHVMRDSVIFRIVSKQHYRKKKKYKVWPMYDFYNSIEDSTLGITHILRSNEFMLRGELQNYIKDLLNLKKQTVIEYGRFNVIGAVTQGREIRALIESGKYTGWDDPRLVTLRALRRRGILKGTYYELAKEVGLSASPTNIDFKLIAKINKRFLDKRANRYFFVSGERKIKINGMPKIKNVEIPLHPDFPERGKIRLRVADEFYVDDDIKEGKAYRLLHLFNFKDNQFISKEHDPKLNAALIHWLPVSKKLVNVKIVMDDGTVKNGFGERSLKKLKVGDQIQFIRFGFVRLDKKEKNKLVFWFTHN